MSNKNRNQNLNQNKQGGNAAVAEKPKATETKVETPKEYPAPTFKEVAPKEFRDNRISPFQIFGFPQDIRSGGEPIIKDHPSFPNPRSAEDMDRGIISEIKEAAVIMEPIKVYWDSEGNAIPLDGKTRLTAIAEYVKEHPETTAFSTIPYERKTFGDGGDREARAKMLHYNLNESRKPLGDADVASAVYRLKTRDGMDEDQIATILNKNGKGGKAWVRHALEIFEANPAIFEALKKSEIDWTTAKGAAGISDFAEQKKAIETVKDTKKKGGTEAQGRKAAGIKQRSNTTLGFNETLTWIKSLYAQVKQLAKADMQNESGFVDWTNEDQRDSWIQGITVMNTFNNLMQFAKVDGTLREQFEWVEANMTADELAALPETVVSWLPESVADTTTETQEPVATGAEAVADKVSLQ